MLMGLPAEGAARGATWNPGTCPPAPEDDQLLDLVTETHPPHVALSPEEAPVRTGHPGQRHSPRDQKGLSKSHVHSFTLRTGHKTGAGVQRQTAVLLSFLLCARETGASCPLLTESLRKSVFLVPLILCLKPGHNEDEPKTYDYEITIVDPFFSCQGGDPTSF